MCIVIFVPSLTLNLNMPRITPDSLMTLEAYAKVRQEFRARMIAYKKNRKIHLGEHITLMFEDEMTVRHQIQEMLRAEKIFEEAGILSELEAYGALLPDGANWCCFCAFVSPIPCSICRAAMAQSELM